MSLLIKHFYRFGEFILDTDQRVLLRDDKPVALTPKVFDTLLILVENKGRIVEKEKLMNRLWPDTFVEEANLTFNIKQLRKSLGDDARNPTYIETVSRRGYRFIADVDEVLTETGAVNDHVNRRIESSDSPLLAPGGVVESEIGERRLKAAEGTSPRTRSLALAAALMVVLIGLALVVWKFRSGSTSRLANGDESSTRASVPLKLERLTATGQSRLAAISPDGKYIAYTRDFGQKSSIWLRQLATNTNVEIVPAGGFIFGLDFTNKGESLYFVRRDAETSLYSVALLGGVVTRIVDRLEGNFSISSNDSQIAFVRKSVRPDGQRQYSLMLVNCDGRGERPLLEQIDPDRLDVPVWSPDDQAIICSSGSSDAGSQDVSLIEVRVADGARRGLSSEKFSHIAKIAWLPDKAGLVMSGRKDSGANNLLWRVSYPGIEISPITDGVSSYLDLSIASATDKGVASQATRTSDIWVGGVSGDGRNLKKITQALDMFCWAPNGRIVYVSAANGVGDIWIMQADGEEQKQLTVNVASNAAPVVTSDNRYIVFTSNRTGALQIWRMNLDGGDQIQLTTGGGKNFPAVSPDGRWIVYNTTDDWHLWKVSIDGGTPAALSSYIGSHPSISPDGKLIACISASESKRELLILPSEGGDPLRRIDFRGRSSRLQWTEDGKALIYAVELNGVRSLVKQLLSGGTPEEIMSFGDGELFDFGYSFDGHSLAVTRGGWQHDVVLLSDLPRLERAVSTRTP
jgi:Tol biopolymer transport system component/DNA-binding winged helix-turn-helix (wHTH) protein